VQLAYAVSEPLHLICHQYVQAYRALAKQHPSFRKRSETTDLICEISLQPWESFRPDGVIIFRYRASSRLLSRQVSQQPAASLLLHCFAVNQSLLLLCKVQNGTRNAVDVQVVKIFRSILISVDSHAAVTFSHHFQHWGCHSRSMTPRALS
jgi:hypothetical protein